MSSFYGCWGGGGGSGSAGPAGVGISSAAIDENGNLVLTYTNNTVQTVGQVVGKQGVTFIPVIQDGILSWTNDGGLPNPAPVDLKSLDSTKWEEIQETIDTLGWGDVDINEPADPSVDYAWGVF